MESSEDSVAKAPPPRPDVVVVMTTQWRASAFGFAGDPNARTPCLDALASEGLWLRQAVTPHPFGVFARAAFITGTRSPDNGLSDYYDALPAGTRTLANAFEELGYQSAFFGKWQLYERDPEAPVVGEEHARVVVPPERRGGFSHWEGFESGFLLNDPLLHGTELVRPTRFPGYQSDVLVERFLRFRARRESGRPLFALLSLDAPHPPYAAPSAGVRPQPEGAIRLLEGTTRDPVLRATARRELAGYYAHGEATDRAVGRLLAQLKAEGRWENTLFAFASAHGDMHGSDGGKFRKGWPHEQSVRVPLLLAGWPGLRRGEDGDLLISLADLGPSLLGLVAAERNTGSAKPFGCHGMDLSPCLRGAGQGPAQQELSMPSAPPFARQCPFAWTAQRDAERTQVFPEGAEPFALEHAQDWRFEP